MKIDLMIYSAPSKYDKKIPYAYEARHRVISGMDDNDSHYCDTICGLIGYLELVGLAPNSVELYEIYPDRKIRIPPYMYVKGTGQWQIGNELCQSFRQIYPDHIGANSCKFSDRITTLF
ncbi:MAG: hypothetical protein GWP63_19620 [Haliea sp.]|jgi:hypothetical protein|nr:hypothetical protein [Haliea sp.]